MNYLFVGFERLKPGLGTGHIVRIKALINALYASDSEVESIRFITNVPDQSKNYSLLLVRSLDEATHKVISCIRNEKIDVVIFDALDYCKSAYAECKKRSIVTIGIDTSSAQSSALDVLINPAIDNRLSHLTGSFYSIHNADHTRQNKPNSVEDRSSIFICFGGIDYQNHFAGIAPVIYSLSSLYEINIIVSSKKDLYSGHSLGENVTLLYRPSNFYELLAGAHFAIISGGILLQECLYMGVPAYVFPQYSHQLTIAKEKYVAGMLAGVSSIQASYKNSIESILSVIEDRAYLNQLSLRSRSSDDGYGLNRVTSILRLIDYMSWDSKFFGKEIYGLHTKSYTPSIKNKIDVMIVQKQIDLIFFLCPSSDSKSIDFALKDGFKCVDERLTYLVTKLEFNSAILDGNVLISRSTLQDITSLESISVKTKWDTRYYNDENFPRDRLKKFYSEWVKKSVSGDLDHMVFHIKEAGTIVGFVTIKKGSNNIGSIGLITVAEEAQGRGFALQLAAYAVNILLDDFGCAGVEVVTQQKNIAACKTYEKLGFKIYNKSKWLHKWI